MNTSHTSIKTDISYSVAVTHILGQQDRHEITTLIPSELVKGGKSSGQILISQTRIVDRLLKLSCILLVRIFYQSIRISESTSYTHQEILSSQTVTMFPPKRLDNFSP